MAYYTLQDRHPRLVHLKNWTWPRREDAGFPKLQSKRTATDLDVVDRVGETLKEKVSECFLGVCCTSFPPHLYTHITPLYAPENQGRSHPKRHRILYSRFKWLS
jgi:hypothetical protein